MDEFKKYLQQHKEQMEIDTPSENVLQRIQAQTATKQKGKLYSMFVKLAAAACILAAIGFGIKYFFYRGDKTQIDIVKTPATEIKKLPDSFKTPVEPDTLKNTIAATTIEPNSNTKPVTSIKKEITLPYQLMNSFEHNYAQLVNLQLKTIRHTPLYGETPDYFNDFKKTLHQIDNDEATVKSNIKTNGLNDELLEQLINVYQQKIDVLKSLQHEMNKMNNKVKENQQPSDTLRSHYINI